MTERKDWDGQNLIPLSEAKKRRFAGPDAPQPVAANDGYVTPKLKTIDPIKWAGQDIPARRWIVPNLVPLGNVTMLSGDGAVGKSILAMQLLTACATSSRWLGMEVMPCRAIGIFCEDDGDELQRRQSRINDHYGVDFEDLENLSLCSRTGPMDENALMTFNRESWRFEATEFYQQVHDAASDFGAQLIVLDSLHDLFEGNENARPEVRKFVQLLRALAADIDGAVLFSAHPSLSGMSNGTGQSGSTGWNNSVRSRLYLTRPKTDDGMDADKTERLLSRMKANYGKDTDDSVIKLRMEEGVFVTPQSMSPTIAGIEARRAENIFLDLLSRRDREGRPVSHKPRAGNYAPKEFSKSPFREGCDRRDFERAMEQLFASGKIKVETYGRVGDTREMIVLGEQK